MVTHGFGIGMVRGSIHVRTKLNFLFCQIYFWYEIEGTKEP